ncbi:MAG: pilus assembly protein [bacterium]|nr:pilus assembly protein [bacterium]
MRTARLRFTPAIAFGRSCHVLRTLRTKGLVSNNSGAAGVEMALVFPFFLMLVLFIFEACRFLYSQAELSHALHGTTRHAMVITDSSSDQLKNELTKQFSILKKANLQSFNLTQNVNADYSRSITISVAYRFDFLVPELIGMDNITINKQDKFLSE